MPRKTDSGNPGDWIAFAQSDFLAVSELSTKQICYEVCRSRLAECLEKTLKAELIRTGWKLVRTHDLVHLADELRQFDSVLADTVQVPCEALAEAYFWERYPGFDLDDPDWSGFAVHLQNVGAFLNEVAGRLP